MTWIVFVLKMKRGNYRGNVGVLAPPQPRLFRNYYRFVLKRKKKVAVEGGVATPHTPRACKIWNFWSYVSPINFQDILSKKSERV